jgi:hypothetical protein
MPDRNNHIVSVDVLTTRFDPAEAEVTVVVTPEQFAPDLEIAGRLMGPKCPYSETVEIAYPLKPLPQDDGLLRARILIPEASPWEPVTPFLYEGPLELRQAGQVLDRRTVSYGLRNLVLRRKGLALNGRDYRFRGARVSQCDEATARRLHAAEVNLLVAPVKLGDTAIWQVADRFGFFVLGQVDATTDEVFWFAEEQLAPHTSCFGWVLPQEVLAQRQVWHAAVSVLRGHRQQLLMGIKLDEPFSGVLPGEVSFVVCGEQLLPEIQAVHLPRIVLAKGDHPADARQPTAVILGHILRLTV